MEDIPLDHITDEQVSGTWEVKDRQMANENQSNVFSSVRQIEIKGGVYRSINGTWRAGPFLLFRENELIYNPQIKFYFDDHQCANAIITRLVIEKDGESKKSTLILYFTTGLELVLQKKHI